MKSLIENSDLVKARNYFRKILNPLGLNEWRDAFAINNIPSNIYDKAFHLENGINSGGPSNQCDQETFTNITLRVFLKGFRDTTEGLEYSVAIGEKIIKKAINVGTRTDSHPVKNVIYNQMQSLPLDAVENDNAVILEMDFTVLVILNPQDD